MFSEQMLVTSEEVTEGYGIPIYAYIITSESLPCA
jgi:hypothetical protein